MQISAFVFQIRAITGRGSNFSLDQTDLILDKIRQQKVQKLIFQFIKGEFDAEELYKKINTILPGVYTYDAFIRNLNRYGIMDKRLCHALQVFFRFNLLFISFHQFNLFRLLSYN